MTTTHNAVIKIGGNLIEKQSRINPQQGELVGHSSEVKS